MHEMLQDAFTEGEGSSRLLLLPPSHASGAGDAVTSRDQAYGSFARQFPLDWVRDLAQEGRVVDAHFLSQSTHACTDACSLPEADLLSRADPLLLSKSLRRSRGKRREEEAVMRDANASEVAEVSRRDA